jgi:type I restriction enzyme S subunit
MENKKEFKVNDVETLPEGWKRVKLGEIIVENPKSPFKVEDANDEGFFPFFTSGEVVLKHNHLLVDGENIFLSTGGSAYVKFHTGKASYSADTWVIRIKNSVLGNKLFYYFLQRKINHITYKYFIGSGLEHLQKDYFKSNFIVVFPESSKEQKKIAEILETVDKAIEKTDAIIEKYKRIKHGLMHDLLTKGIDENRQTRSEQTHKFKDSPLGRIPKEWEVVTVSDFASNEKNAIVDGPFGSNLKIEHYREVGRPVVQSGFVTSNKFVADKYLYVDESKFRSEIRSRVLPGDIVMAKIGAQCGTCAILPDNHPIGILAGNCLKITVSRNNLNKFLEILLHYYYKLGKLELVISTTAQPAISMSSLKKVLIPRPNIMEQHRIAQVLYQIDETIEKEIQYKEKLERLKIGLMEDLLTGKVRVNNLIKEGV